MTSFYDQLADWWHLILPPEECSQEVAFFLSILQPYADRPASTLLELGAGGGSIAFWFKRAFASMVLTDISAPILAASQRVNPECEHVVGDMRDLRVGRTFDVVFIHDAIEYMITLDDLRRALHTAALHCKPDGMVMVVPDDLRETFEDSCNHEGHDGEDGRSIRFLEWSYDPDPSDSTVITDYVFIVRDGDHESRVFHDRQVLGLFALAEWLAAFESVGLVAEVVIDPYDRHVFVARPRG